MKKMLWFFLAAGLFLAGCTESGNGEVPTPGPQDPDLPEISGDSVYVKLCVGGELKITTEPLGRATSDRDLFALNVFSEQEYVTIVYTAPDGKDILLYKKRITYKRLTKYVMQFSLSDAIANGGIDANIMDAPDGELAEEPWEA